MVKFLFPLLSAVVMTISSLALANAPAIPVVTADLNHPPTLPDTQAPHTLEYQATHPEAVEDLARLVRSFTTPTSRIIPNQASGLLQVTDAAASLKKTYDLIRSNDVKPTPEMRAKWRALEQREDRRRRPHS